MKFSIEGMFCAKVMFESSVAIGGRTYLVIYGEHVNGCFCCVPGENWGCEMAGSDDTAYNRDRLIDCGAGREVATEIAKAIKYLV